MAFSFSGIVVVTMQSHLPERRPFRVSFPFSQGSVKSCLHGRGWRPRRSGHIWFAEDAGIRPGPAIRYVLIRIDAAVLDAITCAWISAQADRDDDKDEWVIAIDGKVLRGDGLTRTTR